MKTPIIAPSILSADFCEIAEAVRMIESAQAEWVHLDVMDGHFVPPITFGPQMVANIRARTKRTLDTHLMVDNPEIVADQFIAAGTDYLTFHLEACVHAHRLVRRIREGGVRPGVAIVPSTPISMVSELLREIDLLLILTVNPGYGGQAMIPSCLRKVEEALAFRRDHSLDFLIEIDGGVNADTARKAQRAGVDVLVSGSGFFSATDPGSYVRSLRGATTTAV